LQHPSGSHLALQLGESAAHIHGVGTALQDEALVEREKVRVCP
jgi:hypothetical protein